MHKERLTILRDGLATIPKEKFGMETWFAELHSFKDIEQTTRPLGDELNACGTAACAFGWACSMPALKAQGLEIRVGVGFNGAPIYVIPVYKKFTAFEAAEAFFEISPCQAQDLFNPETYYEIDEEETDDEDDPVYLGRTIEASEVIERIEWLLARES